MEKIYETLTSEVQSKVDGIVETALNGVKADGEIDLVLLNTVLERLNGKKKEIKESIKANAKQKTEEEVRRLALAGKRYIDTLSEGDMITFRFGTGGSKTATLPLEKKGDKTVQVTYTPEMLPEGSKTAKRNIRYDKIVVPEGC